MAKQAESKFYNRIKPKLEALPNSHMIRVQQISNRGTPDILMCVNGLFIAIELKKGVGEKASPLQEWHILKINQTGGWALVVHPDNWKAIYSKLEQLAKGIKCLT